MTPFAANVSVTDVSNTGAIARARLTGAFYNDGTPGQERVGDILADIAIRHHGAAVEVAFFYGAV